MKAYVYTEGAKFPPIANYPKGQISNWCDFSNGNKTFFLGLPNVTSKEIDMFKKGEVLLGAFKQSKVMVMSAQIYFNASKQFAKMGFESVYHPNINGEKGMQDYQTELNKLLQQQDSKIEISFVLFDTVTNVIKGLRTIACDNHFSKEFIQMLSDVNEQKISLHEYKTLTNQIQQHSPESVFEFTTIRLRVEERQ